MKMRGILFSRPMIIELLAKRKWQTRRPVPWEWNGCISGDCPHWATAECCAELAKACRYGQPGDGLFAKETIIPAERTGGKGILYAADYPESELDELSGRYGGWKPSIFMRPAEARLWFRLAELRVEPLRNMPAGDAIAEGVHSLEEYKQLWDAINAGPRERKDPWGEKFYLSQPWCGQSVNRKHRGRTWYVRPNPFVYVLTLEPLPGAPSMLTNTKEKTHER